VLCESMAVWCMNRSDVHTGIFTQSQNCITLAHQPTQTMTKTIKCTDIQYGIRAVKFQPITCKPLQAFLTPSSTIHTARLGILLLLQYWLQLSIIIIISGLHHYPCVAPLATSNRHTDSFTQCEIKGLKVI